MKKLLLLAVLILSFAFDVDATNSGNAPQVQQNAQVQDDPTSKVICNIIKYTQGLGGPMITIVIIGAALLAIFGRMPWPALFALGAFTAVFFGAPAVVTAIAPNTVKACTP